MFVLMNALECSLGHPSQTVLGWQGPRGAAPRLARCLGGLGAEHPHGWWSQRDMWPPSSVQILHRGNAFGLPQEGNSSSGTPLAQALVVGSSHGISVLCSCKKGMSEI